MPPGSLYKIYTCTKRFKWLFINNIMTPGNNSSTKEEMLLTVINDCQKQKKGLQQFDFPVEILLSSRIYSCEMKKAFQGRDIIQNKS